MDTIDSVRAKLAAFRANPDPAIAALDFELPDSVMHPRHMRELDPRALGIQKGDRVQTTRHLFDRTYIIRVIPNPASLKSPEPWTFADLVA